MRCAGAEWVAMASIHILTGETHLATYAITAIRSLAGLKMTLNRENVNATTKASIENPNSRCNGSEGIRLRAVVFTHSSYRKTRDRGAN